MTTPKSHRRWRDRARERLHGAVDWMDGFTAEPDDETDIPPPLTLDNITGGVIYNDEGTTVYDSDDHPDATETRTIHTNPSGVFTLDLGDDIIYTSEGGIFDTSPLPEAPPPPAHPECAALQDDWAVIAAEADATRAWAQDRRAQFAHYPNAAAYDYAQANHRLDTQGRVNTYRWEAARITGTPQDGTP